MIKKLFHKKKMYVFPWLALLSGLKHHPIHQKFEGLMPGQDIYQGCNFNYQ